MSAETKVIVAAGGVVWRDGEVAVIHRPRHDDWSLPKGKLDEDEAPDAAALREVEEETGSRAELAGYAGKLLYEVKGTPKVVFFWHMQARDGEFTPGDEVDELRWLPPNQALELLSHDDERELLARVT